MFPFNTPHSQKRFKNHIRYEHQSILNQYYDFKNPRIERNRKSMRYKTTNVAT